jgi:hypothetical protein
MNSTRSGPINTQVFEDIDGNRLEIDRRDVLGAYRDRMGTMPAVVIVTGADARIVTLGGGARNFIEMWLGSRLEPLPTVESQPTVSASRANPR